jgi:hypothetical protein
MGWGSEHIDAIPAEFMDEVIATTCAVLAEGVVMRPPATRSGQEAASRSAGAGTARSSS